MRRIRITLAYDGTEYYGWQVQPGLPTIQGAVESVVSEIEEATVKVEASGRTDAGVHALAQVAAFSLENPIPAPNLEKAMNRLLPRDIRVLTVDEAPETFHPRYDATAKTYEYRILRAAICSPFERRYVHHHPYPLDEARIFELARTRQRVPEAHGSQHRRRADGGGEGQCARLTGASHARRKCRSWTQRSGARAVSR